MQFGGEELRQQRRPGRDDQGLANDALQLPHIAGPVVGLEAFHRLR